MNDKEFEKRLKERIAEEMNDPLGWWYLSFADEEHYLGGVILEAHGLMHGRTQLLTLGIQSPGGQVAAFRLHENLLPAEEYRNRLLTKDDIATIWPDAKSVLEFEKSHENSTS